MMRETKEEALLFLPLFFFVWKDGLTFTRVFALPTLKD